MPPLSSFAFLDQINVMLSMKYLSGGGCLCLNRLGSPTCGTQNVLIIEKSGKNFSD